MGRVYHSSCRGSSGRRSNPRDFEPLSKTTTRRGASDSTKERRPCRQSISSVFEGDLSFWETESHTGELSETERMIPRFGRGFQRWSGAEG